MFELILFLYLFIGLCFAVWLIVEDRIHYTTWAKLEYWYIFIDCIILTIAWPIFAFLYIQTKMMGTRY